MSQLELVFRIAACSELLLVVHFLLLQKGHKPVHRYGALFFLGISSYLLAPLVLHVWLWGYWAYPLLLFAILVPALFWLFMGALFLDDGLPRGWPWPLIVLTAVVGLVAFATEEGNFGFGDPRYWQWLAQLLKLIWGVMGLMTVLKDWQSDLVETRRRLRLIILAGTGGYILVILVVELFIDQPAQAWVELANVSLILCLVTLFCTHFFAVSPHNIMAKIEHRSAITEDPPPSSSRSLSRSALAQDILRALQEDRFYAREGITIRGLAAVVGSQEYQVRKAINGELGYRNFNAFINLYRIKEIARRLQQPEYDTTPVLTLALDAGFRSLAPFNKAFKDHFTVTPSDFRAQHRNQQSHKNQ
jgi:AraC-like DNA-binding protein